MPTILLGRDQTVSFDGTVSEGTRELSVDISTKTQDVTWYGDAWASTLVLSADATFSITAYGQEVYDTIMGKFNQHPPQRVQVAISNVGSAYCVVTGVQAKVPLDGVVAFDMTFKLWGYS